MSRNDHNEWTDSLDFESLADEQESGGFGGAVGQDGPAPENLDLDEPLDQVPEEEPETETPPPARTPMRPPRRARVSGAGLGFLFAASILVASVGLAGALVTALGLAPRELWQPAGLFPVDGILDFGAHPLNLVYIVAAATVLLALLGAGSVARSVRKVARDAARDARLLDKLVALRVDEEKGWQDPLFKKHPTAAAFINENVGAWRLAEARQRRYAGLEGELQRLTRAAGANSRDGMTDRYDNPTVGSLADELLRLHDERESAIQEAAAIRAKDREEAERLMGLIAESCGWTTAAMDKVGVQGAAVEHIAAGLRKLADSEGGRGKEDPVARAAAAVAALRGNLASLLRTPERAGAADLEELVDRSNKLAFQIAMEVARLGPRGERLLPMTQALEELTTEFRQVADQAAGPAAPEEAFSAADHTLEQVQTALEEASAGSEAWRRTVRDAAPAAADAAAQLGKLASGFNGQADRLNRAGEACAQMTGLPFDASAVAPVDPVEQPEPDLGFTRFDPFAARGGEAPAPAAAGGPFDIDPFAVDEPAPAADPVLAADPFLATDPEPVYDPAGFGTRDLEPAPAEPAPRQEPVKAAPQAGSMDALDLESFGAVRLDAPGFDSEAADEADDVLDLGSFGAVRLDDDMPAFPAPAAQEEGETIHDLAEFGAVPLD